MSSSNSSRTDRKHIKKRRALEERQNSYTRITEWNPDILTPNEMSLGYSRSKMCVVTRRHLIMLSVVGTVCFILVCVTLNYGVPGILRGTRFVESRPPASNTVLRHFDHAVIASDAEECAQIGEQLLRENGSAVDAAIGALLCVGVVNTQSAGIGGGLMMTIYDHQSRSSQALIGREQAPGAATRDMYVRNNSLSRNGWLAVGVPGEVAAYWAAHQKYGRLNWSRLFQPTIDLCRRGYRINHHQAAKLAEEQTVLALDPFLRDLFFNASTGLPYEEGHVIRRPVLASTLELIAEQGAEVLYNGSLAQALVDDIAKNGGIITSQDLANYRVRWVDPATVRLSNGMKVYSVPAPGSGTLLTFILSLMDTYYEQTQPPKSQQETDLMYHRLVESFKFAYARRAELGDPLFSNSTQQLEAMLTSPQFAASVKALINDQHTSNNASYYESDGTVSSYDSGTAQLSVIDRWGSAVSVTSTVNLLFGARVASPSTGILLNNQMDDFSTPGVDNFFQLPPSPANFIEPGKMMMSSMCPSIFVNSDGNVVLVTGAAGGSRITTSTAFTAFRHLYVGDNLKEAIDFPRLHHQLYPMKVHYSAGFPQVSVEALRRRGHRVEQWSKESVVPSVGRRDGKLYGCVDYRKHAGAVGGH